MRSAALIIGVDEYAGRPLTSAVNDAVAFRETLLELGMVGTDQVTLLTTPARHPTARDATRRNIKAEIDRFYRSGEQYDRLFFFFAGHGLLAYRDGGRAVLHTAILPADVEDLRRDGDLLIDVDELLDVMSLAGPREQFYFIDACRDLPYDTHPNVGGLGLAGEPPGYARSLSCLYAVSPLGKAVGQKHGMGAMTTDLIAALRGEGSGLAHDPETDTFVVTIQSVRDHVRAEVEARVKNEPAYARRYLLPELDPKGPLPGPLRVIGDVPPVPVTVHIEPEEAAPHTRIALTLGGMPLADASYPPRANHEAVPLLPQRYVLRAESGWGVPDPARAMLDARREREKTVHVRRPADPPPAAAPRGAPVPTLEVRATPAAVATTDVRATPPVGSGRGIAWKPRMQRAGGGEADAPPSAPAIAKESRIVARALEPGVAIEIEQLDPPYRRWSGAGSLSEPVPPGAYRVRFRLGADVYNEMELMVEKGEEAVVHASAAATPLVMDLLDMGDRPPPMVGVSESIGPMQAGLLDTILPIIGIKPFDARHELFHRFEGLIQPRAADEFGGAPLSLVVAADGDGWPDEPERVVRDVAVQLKALGPDGQWTAAGEPLHPQPLTDLPGEHLGLSGFEARGLARVGTALRRAPGPAFSLLIESPHAGELGLVSAALPGRITVVCIVLAPDGSVRVSQSLLPDPAAGPVPGGATLVGYGPMLRALQLAQRLYHAGELISHGLASPTGEDPQVDITAGIVRDLVLGRWTDPVVSCMACHAWRRELDADRDAIDARHALTTITHDLAGYFGALPDARLAAALLSEDQRDALLTEMLDRNEVPILADGARLLGRYAEEHGRVDTAAADLARRIPHDQIWTLTFL